MKKIFITFGFLVLVLVASVIGLRRAADHYILYLFTDTKTFDFSHLGLKNVESKRQQAAYLFTLFPSLLCPSADHYIHEETNRGELRMLVLFGVPTFVQIGADRNEVFKLLVRWLKDNETDCYAARYLSDFGTDATPALIEAWQGPGSIVFKEDVAHSLVLIGDKSCIPVLLDSWSKNKSFQATLSAEEKQASGQPVFACLALYELTHEEKYKNYIERLLKNGNRISKMLAFTYMAGAISSHGVIVDANMVPFLKKGLKDKDPKVREIAQRNLADINKILNEGTVKTSVKK